jgi:hypothetical protein
MKVLANSFMQFGSYRMKLNLFELVYSSIHFEVWVFRLEKLIFLKAVAFEILEKVAHSFILNHIYWLVSHFRRIKESELAHMAPHIFTN